MVNKSYSRNYLYLLQYANSKDYLFNPNGKSQVLFKYSNKESVIYTINFEIFRVPETQKFYDFVKSLYKELKPNGV